MAARYLTHYIEGPIECSAAHYMAHCIEGPIVGPIAGTIEFSSVNYM